MIILSIDDTKRSLEDKSERLLFASRWLLSPMYVLLIVVLILIVIRFVTYLINFTLVMNTLSYEQWVINILDLIDLTLVANLVLIVTFSGYENFISKLNVAENHIDRPTWMGRLDFSGLKLKIIGSVVAISLIELLQDFLNIESVSTTQIYWKIIIHLTFVATGVAFAFMELLSERRHMMKLEEKTSEEELIDD